MFKKQTRKEKRIAQEQQELPEPSVQTEEAKPTSKQKKPKKEKGEKRERGEKGTWIGVDKLVKSKLALGGFCLVVAGIIAFLIMPMTASRLAKSVPVLRAKVSIQNGTKITSEMVEEAEVGGLGLLEKNVLTLSDVVGKYATTDIWAQDLMDKGKLSPDNPSPFAYLETLPEGTVAISAGVNSLAQSVSAKIRAGDIITFYAVLEKNEGESQTGYAAMQPPELKYVEVLAVSNDEATDIDEELRGQKDVDSSKKSIATVTVKVTEAQAAAIAGLHASAQLHIALACSSMDLPQKEALLQQQTEALAEMEVTLPNMEEMSPEGGGNIETDPILGE